MVDSSSLIEILSDKMKPARQAICEFLIGRNRWEAMSKLEEYGDHYVVTGFKHKDIYPLIGGKHKKIIAKAFVLDRHGNIQERDFNSGSGNEDKIAQVMPQISAWISLVSGIPT